ncbi:flagellar M-ring protein FliF [Acuticoccus sp. M5D2P5]|uniref:flagellar basal-body MS-ring/collar protein FliF n=1 Tax=Acuticoccus kalidii TaxID=2910977 RepID=UPI001F363799|nr:flagellar basal-body MS-ring/collar protein FliF [Acuticoccus kalidii]MCF3932459.1 flagellar M-ring protein FliF [Acuticoccus kalidii]
MTGREHVERVLTNLRELGPRRLSALAAIAIATLVVVGVGASYLAQPQREVLYTGLDREDVTRIGNVLADANIDFDVSPDGDAVLVNHADTAPARMMLAEQGLPSSPNAGYELFDDMSSFGLTSFMQEVTRVRALEGELARTIQEMQGISAARVHLVLSDRGSFRRQNQPASASVVIRTDGPKGDGAADAIRHLVAGAIPAMEIGAVTVLDTRGTVLASGGDPANQSTGKLARLQSDTNNTLEDQIRKTLVPFLGVQNFTVSVTSRLNIDKTRENETIFDPASRVERSVRTVKEEESARNRNLDQPVTVQQNIPQEELPGAGGADSTEDSNRREELTNYEISTRVVERVRDGFAIEHLSIAVLVNQDRLQANADAENGPAVDAQLADIGALVRTAAGFSEERGDELKVATVPFAPERDHLEALPSEGFLATLNRQLGTIINATIVLIVAILLIWFGLRPAIRALTARPAENTMAELIATQDTDEQEAVTDEVNLIEQLKANMHKTPQKRLEQVVDYDSNRVATLLKQWLLQAERV